MTLDSEFVSILRCPVTHQGLRTADAGLLASVNARIRAADLKHADRSPVESSLEEALVTEDETTLYPVRDGIPVLLKESAIRIDVPPPEQP